MAERSSPSSDWSVAAVPPVGWRPLAELVGLGRRACLKSVQLLDFQLLLERFADELAPVLVAPDSPLLAAAGPAVALVVAAAEVKLIVAGLLLVAPLESPPTADSVTAGCTALY